MGASEIGRLHAEWLGYHVFLFLSTSGCSLADAASTLGKPC